MRDGKFGSLRSCTTLVQLSNCLICPIFSADGAYSNMVSIPRSHQRGWTAARDIWPPNQLANQRKEILCHYSIQF